MKKTLPLLFSLVISAPLWAESGSLEKIDKKLDALDQKVDAVQDTSNKIYSKVENNPLGNKHYGVEFNLFRLLLVEDGEYQLSGGFSYFDTQNSREYAFPVFISSVKSDSEQYPSTYKFSTVDFHYRQYLGDTLTGFYLSGFARAAQIKALVGYDYAPSVFSIAGSCSDCGPSYYDSEYKLGIGVGLGYRIISKNGLYWGCGLILGKYVVGENDKFREGDGINEDAELIVDAELLKFGYSF